MRKSLSYILVLFSLSACIYPYSADLDSTDEQTLVVEGNVVIGGISKVYLRNLMELDSHYALSMKGNIYLESEKGARYHASSSASGNYNIDTREALSGDRYRLVVSSNGNTYSTDWIKAEDPPILGEVKFRADDQNVYVQISFNGGSASNGFAAITYEEIWRFHADYQQWYYYNEENNSVEDLMEPDDSKYYCWRHVTKSGETILDYSRMGGNVKDWEFFSFPRSNPRNHEEYNIRIKVRNLTAEEYRYRKLLEDNASLGSSFFSPEPGEIPSNVHCDNNPDIQVLGYVNISQVSVAQAKLDSRYMIVTEPNSLIYVAPEEYQQYYSFGYYPVDRIQTGEYAKQVGWGKARCFDCTADGGTLEKPVFDL